MHETVFAYIKEKYKTSPEYPWERDRSSAVFRHSDNKKWFALVMSVGKDKLGLSDTGYVDVVNLKINDFMFRDILVKEEGIFPAYHMNKNHWITVLLDGTVKEDKIYDLIDISFTATAQKKRKGPAIKMELTKLSSRYNVRRLDRSDVDIIFDLCIRNEIFYQYHPPFATRESILEDMKALPPDKGYEDMFYVGFFDGEVLIAVMDLILGYPQDNAAYIGFFMMNQNYQGKGIGTKIINACSSYLADLGFVKIRLAFDKGNPQSEAFWTKNKFIKTGEEVQAEYGVHVPMERML